MWVQAHGKSATVAHAVRSDKRADKGFVSPTSTGGGSPTETSLTGSNHQRFNEPQYAPTFKRRATNGLRQSDPTRTSDSLAMVARYAIA